MDKPTAIYRIYALLEPETPDARYVGQTAGHLMPRLADHMRGNGASARTAWIRSLSAQGSTPRIVLLEQIEGTRRDAYTRETHWIRKLRGEGHLLVNVP